MASARIAVIGAGISGLSCASVLQAAGVRASVLDKSDHPSGRMSTRRGDGWQCDHGAQYFTARDADFRLEVARWQRAGTASLWSPRMRVIERDRSEARESSVERFVGVPHMAAPVELLAAGLSSSMSTTVCALRRERDGWRVNSADRGWLAETFGAVLLALPAPQVVPLIRQAAPDLAELAGAVRMLGCWALMPRYDTQVDLPFDAAFVNHGPLRWLARDSSKAGRSGQETWVLHANTGWSEAHLDEEPGTVAAVLLEAFAALGAPAPKAWSAHRWRYADTARPLDEGCAWDARIGLGLCGDWIGGGKVEGAWLSGRALAHAVLQDPNFR